MNTYTVGGRPTIPRGAFTFVLRRELSNATPKTRESDIPSSLLSTRRNDAFGLLVQSNIYVFSPKIFQISPHLSDRTITRFLWACLIAFTRGDASALFNHSEMHHERTGRTNRKLDLEA